jgi:hypothetical protein
MSNFLATTKIKFIVLQTVGLLPPKKKLCKGTRFLKRSLGLEKIGVALVAVGQSLAFITMLGSATHAWLAKENWTRL